MTFNAGIAIFFLCLKSAIRDEVISDVFEFAKGDRTFYICSRRDLSDFKFCNRDNFKCLEYFIARD